MESKVKRPKTKLKPSVVFGPCSEDQRLLLMDEETDVILTGG